MSKIVGQIEHLKGDAESLGDLSRVGSVLLVGIRQKLHGDTNAVVARIPEQLCHNAAVHAAAQGDQYLFCHWNHRPFVCFQSFQE